MLPVIWLRYATYAFIAGVDPEDLTAASMGLPPHDSINQWPRIINGSVVSPPRTELPIGDTSALDYNGAGKTLVGGLLRFVGSSDGEHDDDDGSSAGGGKGTLYKLLVGAANKAFLVDQDVVAGPVFPSRGSDEGPLAVRPQAHARRCGRTVEGMGGIENGTGTCLFDLGVDPSEALDLAAMQHELFGSMLSRIDDLQESVFSPDRGETDPAACDSAVTINGGYWGPWIS